MTSEEKYQTTQRATSRSIPPRVSRRTLVKSAAWSLPVIAAAVATPLAAASVAGFDLAMNYTAVQTTGVGQSGGLPVYGPGTTPFLDVNVFNNGPGAASPVQVQIDFPMNLVSSVVAAPSGWSLVNTYSSGGRAVFVYQYTAAPLAVGGSAPMRLFFRMNNPLPAGDTLATVNANIVTIPGDTNSGNQYGGAQFYARG